MGEAEIIEHIKNLRTDRNSTIWDSRTRDSAPHKPFLLLSIIDGIEIGWINSPEITLSQDLIETFSRYWKTIMGQDRNTTIALPFYHMGSEPFWELAYKEGMNPYKNSPSLGGLMNRLAFARMGDDLFSLMRDKEGKRIITETLLDIYFAEKLHSRVKEIHRINVGAYRYAEQLELLAAEPFEKYHAEGEDEEFYSWQKTLQRRQGFGLKVRQNYKHNCAICRARVKTPNGESLVEGAHIIPWNESKNDDPRNGLALCKTHHWMFDTYLLTVQPDYQIKLSTWLKEEGERIDHTLSWDREKILLPKEQRYYPSTLALEEHYQEFKSAS